MNFYKMWFITLILAAAFMTGCGSDSSTDTSGGGGGGGVVDPDAPTVTSTIPGTLETNLIGDDITATFSEEMDAATIISPASTFTVVRKSDSLNVPGVVTYSGNVANFNPDANLTLNVMYTAAITIAATDLAGNPLAAVKTWDFIVGPANPTVVNLGTTIDFAIVAHNTITTTGTTVINGNLALSPAAASFLSTFSPTDTGLGWGTSVYVPGGRLYADFVGDVTTAPLAEADRGTAYTDAASAGSHPSNFVDLYTGDISGRTLCRGVYKWATDGILITGADASSDVTLVGGANDVWIFQTSAGITVDPARRIILSGGAQAKNIFWQAATVVALNTTSHMEGTILSAQDITLNTGATVNGRLLSQTQVTLIGNTVTKPVAP